MADVRCSWPDELWESWQQSGDRTNRRQLQRIVGEWDALSTITNRLREIDSDISIAFGKLLATHELAERYGLNGTPVAELPETTPAQPTATDFEIHFDDCL